MGASGLIIFTDAHTMYDQLIVRQLLLSVYIVLHIDIIAYNHTNTII